MSAACFLPHANSISLFGMGTAVGRHGATVLALPGELLLAPGWTPSHGLRARPHAPPLTTGCIVCVTNLKSEKLRRRHAIDEGQVRAVAHL